MTYLYIHIYKYFSALIYISIHTYVHTKLFFHNISHLWTNKKHVFHHTFRTTSNDLGSIKLHLGRPVVRCGSVGHLFYQCRNMFTLQKELSLKHTKLRGGGWQANFFGWENGKKNNHILGRKGNQVSAIIYCTSFSCIYIIFHGMMLQFKRFLFWLRNRGPGF